MSKSELSILKENCNRLLASNIRLTEDKEYWINKYLELCNTAGSEIDKLKVEIKDYHDSLIRCRRDNEQLKKELKESEQTILDNIKEWDEYGKRFL